MKHQQDLRLLTFPANPRRARRAAAMSPEQRITFAQVTRILDNVQRIAVEWPYALGLLVELSDELVARLTRVDGRGTPA